jgi:hypothetical protein
MPNTTNCQFLPGQNYTLANLLLFLPTKRSGGPAAGDTGLQTLVGHRVSSTNSFVVFGNP